MDVDYDREKVLRSDGEEDYNLSNFNPFIFINPIIREKVGKISYEEGCLSLPGIYEEVERFEKITVDYQDLNGNKKTMDAKGLLSICIQHENDHLDGIVFIDHLSPLKKNLFKKKLIKEKKRNQKMGSKHTL